MSVNLPDLFLEDWIVSQDVVGVEIPQPVGEDHGEGEAEEDDEGRGEERVAAVQQAHHGDCEHDAQCDVQVPATLTLDHQPSVCRENSSNKLAKCFK